MVPMVSTRILAADPRISPFSLQADFILVRAYRRPTEANYKKIVAAAPDSYRVRGLQAERCVWEGKVTNAVAEYPEATKQKPELEGAHRAIAHLYWQGGQIELAGKECEERLRWNALVGESRRGIGLSWPTRGDSPHVRHNLEKGSRVTQDSSHMYQGVAQTWLKLVDFSKSERCLDLAIKCDPSYPPNHKLLEEVYLHAGTPRYGSERTEPDSRVVN